MTIISCCTVHAQPPNLSAVQVAFDRAITVLNSDCQPESVPGFSQVLDDLRGISNRSSGMTTLLARALPYRAQARENVGQTADADSDLREIREVAPGFRLTDPGLSRSLVSRFNVLVGERTTAPQPAQERAEPLTSSAGGAQKSAPVFDVAGGYAWLRDADLTVPNGWFGAGAVNLNDAFGIIGQLSQHTRTINVGGIDVDTRQQIYGVGPRLSGNPHARLTYFVQLLLGGATDSARIPDVSSRHVSNTNFAIQPAGGVDIKAGGKVGVRFQVGETFIKATDDWQKELTFFVGIVVRVG